MQRTQRKPSPITPRGVALADDEIEFLKRMAFRHGRSVSYLIRALVNLARSNAEVLSSALANRRVR